MKKCTIFFLILLPFNMIAHSQSKAIKVSENAIVYNNLIYSKTAEKDLLLDIYLPKEKENCPLVVWVHGGAWRAGNKNNAKHANQLLNEGFAVASINYRLSQEAVFPAQIIDCKAAIRWLRANAEKYGFNPEKIGVWGSSAGGHLVALMGTSGEVNKWDIGENLNQSSEVQAVCDWYAPTDFLKMDDEPGAFLHLSDDSPESQLIGGDIRKNLDKVNEANPITYISGNEPPFLIMHGKEDKTVIYQQSILLHEALNSKNQENELILLDNTRHGGKNWNEQIPIVTNFFKTHLK